MALPTFTSAVLAAEKAVHEIVREFRTRSLPSRLLLLNLVLGTLAAPQVARSLFPGWSVIATDRYASIYWALAIANLIAWLVYLARHQGADWRTVGAALSQTTAIKGLRAFNEGDAELFERLGRLAIIRQWLGVIADSDFHVGLIAGESGAGKTSIIRAGLIPALKCHESSLRPIYVRCTQEDLTLVVGNAVTKAFSVLPSEAPISFVERLRAVAQEQNIVSVIFLDQFEQFLLANRGALASSPFVATLKAWFTSDARLSARFIFCVRAEYAYLMVEVQQALGYVLGPQQQSVLCNFSPEQAVEVILQIAKHEQLDFDYEFVREVTSSDLASARDGLISPVDIQVFLWVMFGHSAQVSHSLDADQYHKVGGWDGLLERHLRNLLEAISPIDQRRLATTILLRLVDLEANARRGALSLEELQHSIPEATPAAISAVVDWLSRNDVRLVTRLDTDGAARYELVHERLIAALRKVTGQYLGEAENVRLLVNSRTNIWLGNRRDSRYLLSARELRQVEKYASHLDFSSQRTFKEELIATSKGRVFKGCLLAAGTMGVIAGLAALPFTERWQKQRAIRETLQLTGLGAPPKVVSWLAVSALTAGESELASDLLNALPAGERERAVAAVSGDWLTTEQITQLVRSVDIPEPRRLQRLRILNATRPPEPEAVQRELLAAYQAYPQEHDLLVEIMRRAAERRQDMPFPAELWDSLQSPNKLPDERIELLQTFAPRLGDRDGLNYLQEVQQEMVARTNVDGGTLLKFAALSRMAETWGGSSQAAAFVQTLLSRVNSKCSIDPSLSPLDPLEVALRAIEDLQDPNLRKQFIAGIERSAGVDCPEYAPRRQLAFASLLYSVREDVRAATIVRKVLKTDYGAFRGGRGDIDSVVRGLAVNQRWDEAAAVIAQTVVARPTILDHDVFDGSTELYLLDELPAYLGSDRDARMLSALLAASDKIPSIDHVRYLAGLSAAFWRLSEDGRLPDCESVRLVTNAGLQALQREVSRPDSGKGLAAVLQRPLAMTTGLRFVGGAIGASLHTRDAQCLSDAPVTLRLVRSMARSYNTIGLETSIWDAHDVLLRTHISLGADASGVKDVVARLDLTSAKPLGMPDEALAVMADAATWTRNDGLAAEVDLLVAEMGSRRVAQFPVELTAALARMHGAIGNRAAAEREIANTRDRLGSSADKYRDVVLERIAQAHALLGQWRAARDVARQSSTQEAQLRTLGSVVVNAPLLGGHEVLTSDPDFQAKLESIFETDVSFP